MTRKPLFYALILCALACSFSSVATAQSQDNSTQTRLGWAARRARAYQAKRIELNGTTLFNPRDEVGAQSEVFDIGNRRASISSQELSKGSSHRSLVGAWRIQVAQSEGGLPPFQAFHVFHQGGTFTETSDLLATLTEGPAQGVWEESGRKFLLTFELFAFANQQPVGIIRVRCVIRLAGANDLTGEAIVDFIDPDGNVFLDIDRGGFKGQRITVKPVN